LLFSLRFRNPSFVMRSFFKLTFLFKVSAWRVNRFISKLLVLLNPTFYSNKPTRNWPPSNHNNKQRVAQGGAYRFGLFQTAAHFSPNLFKGISLAGRWFLNGGLDRLSMAYFIPLPSHSPVCQTALLIAPTIEIRIPSR
jgi:hypothetical protein